MIYAITGTNPDFLGFGLFNQFDEVDIDLASATSTSIVLNNPDTGAVTTLSGSGFTYSGDVPTGGTITGISVSDGSTTIGSLSDFSWSLVAFNQALEALDNNNDGPFAALFNGSGPLTVDASGATSRMFSAFDLDGVLDLLDTGFTYIGSPFGDLIGGTDFNDTYILGAYDERVSNTIQSSGGNDIFDVTGAGARAFLQLFYDDAAITANINGSFSNGAISTSGFTDIIIGLDEILTASGLRIFGSAQNDMFNVSLVGESNSSAQWMSITGGEGVDIYNITLGEYATISLNFGSFNSVAGLVMNLETGVISNDSYGNTEALNITNTGGVIEVLGTQFDDNIIGSTGSDRLVLLTGNDTVDGGDGFDRVRYDLSGVEAVTVNLSTGVATGIWDDTEFTHDLTSIEWVRGARQGNDTIIGSDNDERFDGRGGDDSLVGGGGNDSLFGDGGNDIFLSGSGDDVVKGGSGDDTLYGGKDNDHLSAISGANKMFGGLGADTLEGGSDGDLMGGGGGDDNLTGDAGDDTLWGASGNDVISGGADDDFVGGGANKDKIYGESGDDELYGGGGKDTVDGGAEDDLVAGGAGTDVVIGGSGDDTLWGQAGSDTLSGGSGGDSIAGGAQGDLLQGQQGDDTLNGGYGNDTLVGGADDDVLNGDFGNDVLTGGQGEDIFVFDDDGAKTVTDFDASEDDMLHIDNALWGGANLTAAQVIAQYADDSSGTVIFDFGGGNTITLTGVSSTSGLAGDLLVI